MTIAPGARSRLRAARRIGAVVAGVTVVAGLAGSVAVACGGDGGANDDARSPASAITATASPLAVPLGLGQRDIDLRAGPVAEPITLEIPAIDVDTDVLGVGMAANEVMDAPGGPADSPVWQQGFWYRGSAVPGETSTSLIAGHVNDPLGRPGVFARLDELGPGDEITVHDTRNGSEVRFVVTTARSYSLAEAAEPAVLRTMYGAGPVEGRWPTLSEDDLAHLVLVTCAGTYRGTTHDQRLVVQAVRVP
jgi:hypothetical protein